MKSLLIIKVQQAIAHTYKHDIASSRIVLMRTKKNFQGDISVVLPPLAKMLAVSVSTIGESIGEFLLAQQDSIKQYNLVGGFLNLELSDEFWLSSYQSCIKEKVDNIGQSKRVVIEYGSPNTNKPLHLGHVRNCVLGRAVANILSAVGYDVKQVQIINDRGIHICQSMVAWQEYANAETPDSANLKGDHFVGKYYVEFSNHYRSQMQKAIDAGMDVKEAKVSVPIYKQAQDMLQKWESNDKATRALWQKMNNWVYSGFDVTYKRLGIAFDKNYYESDTYLQGKAMVEQGLAAGYFYSKPDGSIWADLSADGLDHKLLLRSDGTCVYITQDLATALLRYQDYKFNKMIYTVANEQDYHFKVLFKVLAKAGYKWVEYMQHLSYGIVLLPSGRMKSREGSVVDADDLLDAMEAKAKDKSEDLGKNLHMSDDEAKLLYCNVAKAALCYWILKIDAKKDMTFDTDESITFTGNTGPFIQYAYARIQSILRKCERQQAFAKPSILLEKEKDLIATLLQYNEVLIDSAEQTNPSIIVSYVYTLAKQFNNYYHDTPILKAEEDSLIQWRLELTNAVAVRIKQVCDILSIPLLERM